MSTKNHFNHYLGIEIINSEEGRCVAILPIRTELCNSIEGVVHGGVTNTLADVVMGHGAVPPMDGLQQCVTVESKINYLSPAKGRYLHAESQVLKSGKKIVVMEARITTDDGRLVAVAMGTYARINTKQVNAKGQYTWIKNQFCWSNTDR